MEDNSEIEHVDVEGSNFNETLRNIIKIFWDIFRLGLRMWWVMWLMPVVFIAFAYKYTKNFETNYTAKITFLINQEMGDPSALGSITPTQAGLGNFGSQNLIFNPEKIRQFARTNKIITNVLFKTANLNGQEDYLANHYSIIYGLGFKSGYFKNFISVDSFTREQVSALGLIQSLVRAGNFMITYDDSKIFTIVVNTKDEALSYELCNAFYEAISEFYVQKTTEKAKLTYSFLSNRMDSIRNRLYSLEYAIANFQDRNHNISIERHLVEPNRMLKEKDYLNNLFFATSQSFEAAKINLSNITPVFQVIDQPYYPLPWDRKTKKIYFVLAVFAGLVMNVILVLVVWLFREYGKSTIKFLRDAISPNEDTGSEDHSAEGV